MIETDKIKKIDVCSANGHLLFSLSKNYSFPPVEQYENPNSRLFIKGKGFPEYPRGTSFILLFYTKIGDRYQYPATMELSTDSQMVLHLTLVKKATVKERRRFFKADCGKECVIKILQRDDEAFDIHPQINGTIVNINLGGVLISAESKFEFAIDDIITIEMPDMLGSKAVFNVKVLRCVRSPDGERVDIGCCFIGVDPRTEGEIARYINILQREKILEEKAKAELEL